MKKRFIKTPLVGVQVHGAKDVGTRTVNLLMGEHAGEYVRGDIMDANAVIQALDEIKGSVDTDYDSLEEIVDEIHNLRDDTDQNFEVFQEKVEEEITNRTQGDNALDEKINTEKQERINADTQLRNDLTTETNRAKASENTLASNIQAEATKRENDDNTIKDNLNAEVTRATGVEATKASVDDLTAEIARAKQAEAAITSDVTEKLAQKVDTTTLNERVGTLNAAIDTKQPKGNYLTEHQSLEEYAKKVELPTVPTKVSQLTNDSNFITQQDADAKYALANSLNTVNDSISSLRVGLSKKQDKITVNSVDVTDIETADITKLRTIVRGLIDALNTSGLIREQSNIE